LNSTPWWITPATAIVSIIATVIVAIVGLISSSRREQRAWQREDRIRSDERERAERSQYNQHRITVYAEFLGTLNSLMSKRPEDKESRAEIYQTLHNLDAMVAIIASPRVSELTREFVTLAIAFNREFSRQTRGEMAESLYRAEHAVLAAMRAELGIQVLPWVTMDQPGSTTRPASLPPDPRTRP
jgi:hypothetical protein